MDKLAQHSLGWGAAILGFAWLMPGHYFPWFTFQQEFAAAVGACLIGLAAVASRPARVSWPVLACLAMAAAAIPMLQLLFGQIRFVSDAVLAASYVAAFGLAVSVGATLTRDSKHDLAGPLMAALAAAAILSAGMGLMQWLNVGTGGFVDDVPRSARFYANFGQPNNLATALAIGVCALLLGHARGVIGPFGTALGIAFLGFGMVMTQSRTGWLFVALLGLGLIGLKRRAKLRVSPVAAIMGMTLFAVAAAGWASLNELLLLAPQDEAASRVASGGTRPIHWKVMWHAIWQHPWVGYGWTQALLGQQAAVLGHPATGEVLNSSHNIALDLLVWNGVPLGVVLLGALVWWFARQFRLCQDAERAYLLAAVGAIFLHGMLELALEYAFFLLPAGLLMGALDGRDSSVRGISGPRLSQAIPLLMLAGVTAWVGVEYMEVDRTARTMRFVAMGIGTDRVSTAPEPEVILLDRPRNLHRYMLTAAKKTEDPHYLPWVRGVAMRHPMAPAMLRHALAAGLNGEMGEAAAVLARLCKMHMAALCDQGRSSWAMLQQQHPELRGIPYPTTPQELRIPAAQPAASVHPRR